MAIQSFDLVDQFSLPTSVTTTSNPVTILIDSIVKNAKLLQDTHNDEKARQEIIAAAGKLVTKLETPTEQMARIGYCEPTRNAALRIAFEMGLLQNLTSIPQNSTQLGNGLNADVDLVARILKHLAAWGIINETGPDLYTSTPFSTSTSTLQMSGALISHFECTMPTYYAIPSFLTSTNYTLPLNNSTAFQFAFNTQKSMFEHIYSNPHLRDAFGHFMSGYHAMHQSWVDFYPVSRLISSYNPERPLLVDIGGGLGQDLLAFLAKHPVPNGALVLEDLPNVTTQASLLPSFPTEITLLPHDFLTPQPPSIHGAKCYALSRILHNWPEHQVKLILSHIRNVMAPGYSKLIINEAVLRDEGESWLNTSSDWVMLALFNGRERTEGQWTDLLASVGLKIEGIWEKNGVGNGKGERVIEAVVDEDWDLGNGEEKRLIMKS